jgi:protein-disulfide isomerase
MITFHRKYFNIKKSKKLYSLHKEAEKFKLESGTEDFIPKGNESPTEKAKRLKEKIKDNLQKQLQSRCESKPLHRQ